MPPERVRLASRDKGQAWPSAWEKFLLRHFIGTYTWNKKKCKLFRKRTPNPAVVRLEGVAPPLKAYLLSMDFIETAQYIAGQVNDASPNLSAEKTELVQVSTQINNGVKAILSGLDVPELKEELDRLRVRRSEPKDIIARHSSDRPEADPAAIVQLLQNGVAEWNDENLPQSIRQHITKIYAHIDGNYTVNVGVYLNGCGDRI